MAKDITRQDLETLILATLNDDKFRALISKDPESAMKQLGIEPTPERVAAVRGVDPKALKALAASFGMPIGIN